MRTDIWPWDMAAMNSGVCVGVAPDRLHVWDVQWRRRLAYWAVGFAFSVRIAMVLDELIGIVLAVSARLAVGLSLSSSIEGVP